MPLHPHITSLFTPQSIAVVGASHAAGKIGNIILDNLIRAGFSGKIFPVNPAGGSILGLPVLCNLAQIPAPLDLAVLSIPAEKIPVAMRELATIPTRAAIIISAGFKETGKAGAALEREIYEIARQHNIAVLGPNCLGLANTTHRLNLTFTEGAPLVGNIGFFSQSGAFCAAMYDWARQQNIGFSSFVSLGNKVIVDESDILAYLADDPATKVIVGYLESVECGQRFLRMAQRATRQKPVILLKAGRTAAGARAASSHTGALAGADLAYEAAFKQTGIIRVGNMEDLFGIAQGFASQPLPGGPGIAIVTNAGGPGIVATDASEEAGLTLARLSSQTIAALKEILPPFAALYNPVDVIGDSKEDAIAAAVNIVLQDPSVHSLLLLAGSTARTCTTAIASRVTSTINTLGKPVFTCLLGGESVEQGRRIFVDAGIPCYPFPEPAIRAIATMYRQSQWKDNPMPVEIAYRRDLSRARVAIATARAENCLEMVEFQAQGLLKAYELPVLEARLARTSDEAVSIAKQLGGNVALKIASPQISHKTDVQGVVLNLDSPEKIRESFQDITSRALRLCKGAYIAGCLVQTMAPKHSREIIIGFKRDARFGPMVIFGLGGIHVETFKDISCRLAPLSLSDVHDMIREIKAFPILAGLRGEAPVKFTAIEDILFIMSQMALDFPEIQEAECNPVLAYENGAFVADMRVLLTPLSQPAGAAPETSAHKYDEGQGEGTPKELKE